MTGTVDKKQAAVLLNLAREAIAARLRGVACSVDIPDEAVFNEEAATFVTLKIKGALRGCMGNLEPSLSLWTSVSENAVKAAFGDMRFMPLSLEELDEIDIHISVLTKLEPLAYDEGEELLHRLRPGVDGVVLCHGKAGATFLPQVWEQLPDPEQFLGHLCRKAGLYERCWEKDHPDIFVYQVQSFGEED
ncbi:MULTISPECIES: AmmeMemoRadiSam system protein A [Desulfosediminicola]|uniref:AmmeMemoRadiSam system protein A n=1 Tax=Desulfosediminicola TaxID=2886823 RepID=UPI00142E941D|nr:AmmeMemoRadiSam system protein A [Desulfosediminicola ganghwensis]